jgi:hypothetical protein
VSYLYDLSARLADRYEGDCVGHAEQLARVLLDVGCSAWIGAVRDFVSTGDREYHGPLVPLRYLGRGAPAWTVHYVCCSEGWAYDPLVGEPVAVEELARRAFGRDLPLTVAVSETELAALLKDGGLRQHIRSAYVARRETR